MKKKVISMMLCLSMAASVCACGNTNSTNGTQAQTSETKESKATESAAESSTPSTEVKEDDSLYPVVDEPITVTGVYVGNEEISDGRLVWDKVAEITGVNFEWISVDWETLPVYLASGDWDFDFIHYKDLDATSINDYGVLGGKFADYNDYLEYMPHLQKTFEDYPEALKAVTESNGAIYRLPAIEISATMTQIRPYYRTDILEAAGVKAPTTTEEFYQVLKTLKEKNGAPGWCPYGISEDSYFGGMLFAAFGTAVNPDFADDGTGKVVYNRTSEQYKHYLEFMNKLYEEELIDQEYLTVDWSYCLGLTQSGQTAFLGQEAHSLTEADFADGKFHLSVLAPFTSEYSDDQEVLAQLPVSANGFFLNAKSENLVPLVQALDIMFATEEVVEGSGLLGQSFTYGLEGEHWQRNEDGTYETLLPEGVAGSYTDFQYDELIFANAGRATALEGYGLEKGLLW